jgi:prepilin-type N-terminal cleavage/methylation domain-containing protein
MSTAPTQHWRNAHWPRVSRRASRFSASISRMRGREAAFTLIELLVVISIIGLLASLTVGLTGLATRKSKEARIRTEMTKLVNAIENYKTALGFYPPDHRITDPANPSQDISLPSPNQLFYELSGTIYTNAQFYIPGRQEGLNAAQIQAYFGKTSGFANAARDPQDLKFTEEFKSSQYQRIRETPYAVDVLAVPVPGPARWAIKFTSTTVNPWLYVSTSPTNNPDRYDLWTEVVIGGKTIRFSNWEKDPVVESP